MYKYFLIKLVANKKPTLFQRLKQEKLIGILTLVLLAVAIPITVTISQKQQNTKQEAASSSCANIRGKCIDVIGGNCWTKTIKGLCPGSARVQCCPPKDGWIGGAQPNVNSCANAGGKCINTSTQNCNGIIKTGLCPGASNVKCCTPSGVNQCRSKYPSGKCQYTSQYCSGSYVSGLCPGGSDYKCCTKL